jgi:hypothetical protein
MRTDPAVFAVRNTSAQKSPRFVIKIEYSSYSLHLSSHNDIDGVPSPHLEGCVVEPSISSQKLNPDQGRAEIGAASFAVLDRTGALTSQLRSLLVGGQGLRGRQVRFYLGYEGMNFTEFVLVGTQIVKDAAYDRGAYRIGCHDVQRAARKDIFVLANTTISATVEATDTTINVYSTTGFSRVQHGAGWSDAASSTVGYVKIRDEIVRYTGTTPTSFTGCTRGVLGTSAARYVADGATAAARREKVAEYVYLELPGPKLLYAILTGQIHGLGATLPSAWHLGISTNLVRLADFTGLGTDLWDTSDDSRGVILRFEGLTKVDGKAFAELEILRLLGLYMPVYADGTLGLRRMTRVLADAGSVVTLDASNSVMTGDLQHDMESLHNVFSVFWNWNGKDYTRQTTYVDAASVSVHGRASDMELKFKGLYGGRHTDGLVFKMLDSIRDRYSAPPVRLSVDVLHSLNPIEVGDIVRVRHSHLRDYAGQESSVDRAFEVQSISVNHRTGAVSLDLFGSTSSAAVTSPTTPTTAAADGFYTAAGTNLTGVMTITSGVVSGGPYTLAGGTDLTAAGSIWYYNGDLTIPEGVTVNISGNVQIRVKGYLTINGTITGVGGGLSGVADNSNALTVVTGNPGWVGASRGHDGCVITALSADRIKYRTMPPATTAGRHPTFPYIALEVSGNSILGIPTDLRGTGGGPGGKVLRVPRIFGLSVDDVTFLKAGGTGGAGGAGLCTVSRGLGLGANGRINLSGADTAAAAAYTTNVEGKSVTFYPGAGGAGGPGSYLCLIDGSLLSVPDLAGRFVARTGRPAVPTHTTALASPEEEKWKRKDTPFVGFVNEPSVISALDLSYACQRIQYVPASETAVPDSQSLAAVTDVIVFQGSSGFVVSFTPSEGAPSGTVYEIWEHTAATPFASAVKRMEGAATAFFVPRPNTTTVYVWVRARYRMDTGVVIYSTQVPAADGIPAASAANAGTYATATPTSVSGVAASTSITTGAVTAGLVGATPTTYSWARISGSTSISANSASAASTTFTATGVGTGVTVSAVFRCTVNGSYTVDVAVDCTNQGSTLAVTASPSTLTASADASQITTAASTANASGGTGSYAFVWTRVSGSTGISAVSPNAAASTFTATGLTNGEARSAVMRCTVTDASSNTATVDVSVTITRLAAPIVVTLVPTAISADSPYSTITTGAVAASAAGGTAPYSYAWTQVSGGGISANSPASYYTTFTATLVAVSETRTATWRCTATDALGVTGTRDIDVSVFRTWSGEEP